MQSKLFFYGGAGSVTGSNFMLEVQNPDASVGARFLIDCGLFQGEHALQKNNWDQWSFDPTTITALINTHAHIDHIGRIPKLVKDGYRGPIISTKATRALAEPMLLDALELNERDAKRHNVAPLYTKDDIAQALKQWEGIEYHEPKTFGDVIFEFYNAGHILGSALAKFTRKDGGQARSIVFSGDLGGGNSPLLPLAEVPEGAQYLLIESVYGDRKRDDTNRREALENSIEDAVARGGTLLIPAFSTERTQDLLFEIKSLMQEKRIPSIPVYLDSPLAEQITAAFEKHPEYFKDEIKERALNGEHIFAFPELHFVSSVEESAKLHTTPNPKIILAGSGMSNGGRVIDHEKHVLQDAKSTLLIVGYQAAGSLGRKLVEGAKQVEIYDIHSHTAQKIEVRAHVQVLYGYSAHMDGEQLLEYVNKMSDTNKLEEVFVVMGEIASSSFLAQRIRDYLGVKATTPEVGESVTIAF
ncbi:MAG: metallo-beta-lactamase family protein [Patescibacteria group bacterium]|nr:metallo-beta-lactamase family protein [Patescibacteria group bacterium]